MLRKEKMQLRDAYYTDPEVAKELIRYFEKEQGMRKYKTIIEPSAGNGSFFIPLREKYGEKVVGFDIVPKHPDIRKQNFLTLKMDDNDPATTICIGNPPFGRQSALARKFVEKCSEISENIVFIVPISYNYIPKGYEQIFSKTLSDDIFVDPRNRKFHQPIKTKYVYYKKTGIEKTKKNEVYPNELWDFKNKTSSRERNESDFRIIRASGSAGKAISKKSSKFNFLGSTYNDFYIKINTPIRKYIDDIIDDINEYEKRKKWIFNNTTTFKSINKSQIARVLNTITQRYLTTI